MVYGIIVMNGEFMEKEFTFIGSERKVNGYMNYYIKKSLSIDESAKIVYKSDDHCIIDYRPVYSITGDLVDEDSDYMETFKTILTFKFKNIKEGEEYFKKF